MGENSRIEWCHHTFNPWIGCTKVSPACDHCYAETLSKARLGVTWGPGQPRRRTADSTWRQPLAWNRKAAKLGIRYRVFCASLADVLDTEVPDEWRADLFALIDQTPHLDWLLLTKRPAVARKVMPETPRPNVWLGTTVENQQMADARIPHLLATPAAVRFLSCEPLLGAVDLTDMPCGARDHGAHGWSALWKEEPFGRGHLDWVIVGGESGPGARPMHPDWARSLRDQCKAAGVPFFFKQWGEWRPSGGLIDGRLEPGTHGLFGDGALALAGALMGATDPESVATRKSVAGRGSYTIIRHVGKKAAGRLLDGVVHDAVPAPEVR